MGKRELLLVLGFAVVGTIVYQFTARPAAEGEPPLLAVDRHRPLPAGSPRESGDRRNDNPRRLPRLRRDVGAACLLRQGQRRDPDHHGGGSRGRVVGAPRLVEWLRRRGGGALRAGDRAEEHRSRRAPQFRSDFPQRGAPTSQHHAARAQEDADQHRAVFGEARHHQHPGRRAPRFEGRSHSARHHRPCGGLASGRRSQHRRCRRPSS